MIRRTLSGAFGTVLALRHLLAEARAARRD